MVCGRKGVRSHTVEFVLFLFIEPIESIDDLFVYVVESEAEVRALVLV